MEVKTVSGFVRKQKEAESAITEQADRASSKIGVCRRVVAVNKAGRNARVPVKILNMSAKALTIPPRALLLPVARGKGSAVLQSFVRWDKNCNNQSANNR